MNQLTWILYIADVVGGLSVALVLLGLVGTFAMGALAVVFIVHNYEIRDRYATALSRYVEYQGRYGGAANPNPVPTLKEFAPTWMPVCGLVFFVILWFAVAFVPSKQTILMMAGSQFGEQVVKTPEAQALFKDIQEVIQLQLKSMKGQ